MYERQSGKSIRETKGKEITGTGKILGKASAYSQNMWYTEKILL